MGDERTRSPIDWSSAISAGVSTLGTLLGGKLSQSYNEQNMALQNQYAKDLMDYQWQNYNSFPAQVRSMREAGLNPAVMYGQGGQSAASPSVNMPSSAPVQIPNVFDINSLSNFILSTAQAKKAGMDTRLSEQEIKNKQVEQQRNEFELKLRQQFGADVVSAELANSYMQLILSSDQSDINELQKALKNYEIQSEKAIAKVNEHKRDILKQELDNNPTKIALENRLTELRGTESAAAAEAHRASAEVSRTQADVNRENRRLQSALADIEESSKVDKIDALIRQYNAEGALSDADYKVAALKLKYLKWRIENREDEQRFEDIDNLGEWLKDKVSIFKLAK